jgi:hypothetical protein
MNSQFLWYLTRATGIVALVLLTCTVVLGVLGTARVATERWPRIVTAGLHRNLALPATAFVRIHVITIVLDGSAACRTALKWIRRYQCRGWMPRNTAAHMR